MPVAQPHADVMLQNANQGGGTGEGNERPADGLEILAAKLQALVQRQPQFAGGCVIEVHDRGTAFPVTLSVALDAGYMIACVEERAGYAEALRQAAKASLGIDIEVYVGDHGSIEFCAERPCRIIRHRSTRE